MAEITINLKPVKIDYECDKCKAGRYAFSGIVLTSYPPQYPHVCDECDDKKTFNVKYPYIKYIEIIQ